MENTHRRIVYIDMDDTLCDFKSAYDNARRLNPDIKHPQSQYGFFTNLKPIQGAVEFINQLRRSKLYDPYILTAPSTRNPFSYLEKRVWIAQYFDYEFTKKLIICAHKNLLKGDFLIDDNTCGKGQENFEGKLIHFGSDVFPSWREVTQFFDG